MYLESKEGLQSNRGNDTVGSTDKEVNTISAKQHS